MRKRTILGAVVLSVLAAGAGAEVPLQAQACVACHGAGGRSSNPEWPNLAGQHEAYLVDQLRAFRDGRRENVSMAPFVNNLSDQDIAVLAEYYASQELAIAASGDTALVDKGRHLAGYCAACHGMRGEPAANEWPILAGQHAPYLKRQLLAYQEEERIHSLMQAAIAHLGEEEFAALAAYYSQLQP